MGRPGLLKILTIAALVLAGVATALAPVLSTLYAEAFPTDPGKEQALRLCGSQDPGFNRLIAASRTACYERNLNAQPTRPGHLPPPANETSRPSRLG